jgi:hypothetical protein
VLTLAQLAGAPLTREAGDAGGREKYVVNTREALARGVELVNNHGIYAHNWHEMVRVVPPRAAGLRGLRGLRVSE